MNNKQNERTETDEEIVKRLIEESPWERAMRQAAIDNAFAGAVVDALDDGWGEQ